VRDEEGELELVEDRLMLGELVGVKVLEKEMELEEVLVELDVTVTEGVPVLVTEVEGVLVPEAVLDRVEVVLLVGLGVCVLDPEKLRETVEERVLEAVPVLLGVFVVVLEKVEDPDFDPDKDWLIEAEIVPDAVDEKEEDTDLVAVLVPVFVTEDELVGVLVPENDEVPVLVTELDGVGLFVVV
jgi:hypothetical protein